MNLIPIFCYSNLAKQTTSTLLNKQAIYDFIISIENKTNLQEKIYYSFRVYSHKKKQTISK
jgi:hypothetical protein